MMETVRKIVRLEEADRQLSIALPETIGPGLVEVLVVMQPILQSTEVTENLSEDLNLFGFMPDWVDPLEFQQQLRSEWDE